MNLATDLLFTKRMTLRPITVEDRDLLVLLDADPEVMKFLTGGRPSTTTEVDQVIGQSLGHRWLGFEHNNFVGWFGLQPGQTDGEAQLGYRLRRSMWGRGMATEGASRLVDLGFAELGYQRIWAETMAVNEGSRRVMERCGMSYVRTFLLEWDDPIAGSEQGEVEYAIDRRDWDEGPE